MQKPKSHTFHLNHRHYSQHHCQHNHDYFIEFSIFRRFLLLCVFNAINRSFVRLCLFFYSRRAVHSIPFRQLKRPGWIKSIFLRVINIRLFGWKITVSAEFWQNIWFYFYWIESCTCRNTVEEFTKFSNYYRFHSNVHA